MEVTVNGHIRFQSALILHQSLHCWTRVCTFNVKTFLKYVCSIFLTYELVNRWNRIVIKSFLASYLRVLATVVTPRWNKLVVCFSHMHFSNFLMFTGCNDKTFICICLAKKVRGICIRRNGSMMQLRTLNPSFHHTHRLNASWLLSNSRIRSWLMSVFILFFSLVFHGIIIYLIIRSVIVRSILYWIWIDAKINFTILSTVFCLVSRRQSTLTPFLINLFGVKDLMLRIY